MNGSTTSSLPKTVDKQPLALCVVPDGTDGNGVAKIPQQATEPFERVVNYRTIVRITIAHVWRRR
jgi:hypothetical protein